ncbi:uncharacterized protein FMAN_13798 [Fusarium mangiferae]|uniref:Uncharacterized protein n=1 Tax=Fusarium mangiferae TaxID=192010 RepID=A0A1L7TJP9_FUSMA|nr:uncharacterized protein FMAN_13798 [Fusarium mangiferae]CVK95875.1 uncharacterized protein FMAN_13798 [Fusarium mangiferae]
MANFSDLLREIRDMIWALVPRDYHPGVHIFGHYDENQKGMAEGRSMVHGSLFSGILSEPSPDRYFNNLDKDRKNENISTYLIDGAMWNTCKESRLAIEKRFKQYEWPAHKLWWHFRSDLRAWSEYPYHLVFEVPSTGHFEGSSPHYLTWFPHRDLFIFQFDKLDSVDWHFVGSRPTRGGLRPLWRRLQHIAIEYNPEWWDEVSASPFPWDRPNFSKLMDAAFELKDCQKLWFIDRTLKRRKDAPTFKEEAYCHTRLNAFYARDRKFLEIDCGLCPPLRPWSAWRRWRISSPDDGILKNWEYVKPVGDTSSQSGSSSIDFVRQLEESICQEHSDGIKTLGFDSRGRKFHCRIGLLGWEEL